MAKARVTATRRYDVTSSKKHKRKEKIEDMLFDLHCALNHLGELERAEAEAEAAAELFDQWAAWERAKGRPENELTRENCVNELVGLRDAVEGDDEDE